MKPIIIDYEPVAKGMPRTKWINGQPLTYTPTKTQVALDAIFLLISNARRKQYPVHVPLRLEVTFYRQKSKWLPKRETMPFRKPDLDNFIKTMLDSTQQLIPDDAQITTIIARKRWSNNGHGYIELKIDEDK